jgi:hypothetical protein
MLELIKSVMAPPLHPNTPLASLRSIRPSLLDVRFTGDPWVVDHADGTASLRLDNYRLARIQAMPFDLPSLNQLLLQLRQWQIRRRFYEKLRALRAGSVSDGPIGETRVAPSAVADLSGS